MKKHIIRLISLSLVAVLLIGCLTSCSRTVDSRIPAIEASSERESNLVTSVKIADKKTVHFYDDRYKVNDEIICYNDIETIFYDPKSSTTTIENDYGEVSFGGSSVSFEFITKDGKKHELKAEYSYFIFQDEKKVMLYKTYATNLYNAVYKTVVNSMVQRAVAKIMNGETITISELQISKESFVFEKDGEKSVYDSSNYYGCKYVNGFLCIVDKNGNVLWYVGSKDKGNLLLLPRILYLLYWTQSEISPVEHDENTHEYNGHYYEKFSLKSGESVTWEEANQYAKEYGGYLLQIGSAVDDKDINLEAQWVYKTFCKDESGEFFMANNSKFTWNNSGIDWSVSVNDEKLKSWIVEYDY